MQHAYRTFQLSSKTARVRYKSEMIKMAGDQILNDQCEQYSTKLNIERLTSA